MNQLKSHSWTLPFNSIMSEAGFFVGGEVSIPTEVKWIDPKVGKVRGKITQDINTNSWRGENCKSRFFLFYLFLFHLFIYLPSILTLLRSIF